MKNYIADVHLIPITNDDSTFIEWASSWESATNSEEITGFCNPIYAAILYDLANKHA